MQYITKYQSPLGAILLAADEQGLTGLWFQGQKYFSSTLAAGKPIQKADNLPIFSQTKQWLDCYFAGRQPDFTPELHLIGSDFQLTVWEVLRQIPYGQTTTYGQIAQKLSHSHGLSPRAAQAVGGAVGHNPISIIIPCHRVLGAKGNLTGYAGGIHKKTQLLQLEQTPLNLSKRPKELPHDC